ncbi:hypothetical protein OVA13_11135 [Pseudoxanthomonas sp. SL93]|uniref:hypothetical protein n=1 Tax=Pseudoxanthomonas sp. SL93 TaxID=2995142 RepID=UPI00226D731A|nr:hypothetical protein [Pseudoxanthomonas sp. SL93]WAC61958.1 hypothetical protein OVA13_11135 [Pseudoxanthomonas sp. SL93]
MNTSAITGLAGTWQLLPDQCDYQLGRPPRSARYRLGYDADGTLSIASEWVSANGQRYRVAFDGPVDGKPHAYHSTPLVDALSFESVSPTQLHSATWHEGRQVQWSERELVDQDTLVIRMHGHLSNGRPYTNVGVYRRQAA